MIFLIGHRACGKTTVGEILRSEGFLVFDTGPFWRKLRDAMSPEILSTKTFRELLRESSGNQHYDQELLIQEVLRLLDSQPQSKDIVIVGYRDPDEAAYLEGSLQKSIPQIPETQIWYVECPLEIAHQRLISREEDSLVQEKDLVSIWEMENDRGLATFRNKATWIIDNTIDENSLHDIVRHEIYAELHYETGHNLNQK